MGYRLPEQLVGVDKLAKLCVSLGGKRISYRQHDRPNRRSVPSRTAVRCGHALGVQPAGNGSPALPHA